MSKKEMLRQIEAIIKQKINKSNNGELWGEDDAAGLIYELFQEQDPKQETTNDKDPKSIPVLRWILDDIEFGYDAGMIKSKILNKCYQ